MILQSKYIEDGNGVKVAPITTPQAVRWPDGSNLSDNVAQADWNESDTDDPAYIKNKPSSLPANGGNAATVNSHTVNSDVPANAVFTDTTYTTMGASGSSHSGGLVPDTPSTAGTTKFLREDGQWEVPTGGSGEANVIESISVNGTPQTITNKNVNITVPTALSSLNDDTTHRVVTDTEKTTWDGKLGLSGSTYEDHVLTFDNNGKAQDSGLGIVVTDFSVSDLIDNTLSAATISKLTTLRGIISSAQYYLFIPCNTQTGYVAATIYNSGSSLEFRFIYDHTEVTVTGDPYNNYTVTVTPFINLENYYTKSEVDALVETEPVANAAKLNNIMLMFDLPKSQNSFYTTDNNKHYFYVQPPKSANIDNEAMLADWLAGGLPSHLSVTISESGSTVTFTYNGSNTFIINADNDPMLEVTCTKIDDNVYQCEMEAHTGSGPSAWVSFEIV